MAENNIWEKEEDLENTKELVDEFEERLGAKVRRAERIDKRQKVKLNPEAEELRREELLERYMAKLLYGWDDKKFDKECLKKLEKNWDR